MSRTPLSRLRWRAASISRARCAAALLAAGIVGCGSEPEIEVPSPLSTSISIQYPLELWDQGIEGRSVLRVRVTDRGGVDSVVILESSGHAAFDSAAVRGVRALRFTPTRRDGKAIEAWAQVPVQFSKEPRL